MSQNLPTRLDIARTTIHLMKMLSIVGIPHTRPRFMRKGRSAYVNLKVPGEDRRLVIRVSDHGHDKRLAGSRQVIIANVCPGADDLRGVCLTLCHLLQNILVPSYPADFSLPPLPLDPRLILSLVSDDPSRYDFE